MIQPKERKLLADWAASLRVLPEDDVRYQGQTYALILAVEAYVTASEALLREVARADWVFDTIGTEPFAEVEARSVWDWQKRIAALLGPAES